MHLGFLVKILESGKDLVVFDSLLFEVFHSVEQLDIPSTLVYVRLRSVERTVS